MKCPDQTSVPPPMSAGLKPATEVFIGYEVNQDENTTTQ